MLAGSALRTGMAVGPRFPHVARFSHAFRAQAPRFERSSRQADGTSRTPEESAIEKSLREDIRQFVNGALTHTEAEILQYRFGLNCLRPMSLKEIGAKYELTKERIRQIVRKAVEKLKDQDIMQAVGGWLPQDRTT